ncbi:MAG: hypothetical protein ACI4E5_13530 [Suilimivivens sp.]
MPELVGLRKPYIQVRRTDSDCITYGGDQGFFGGAPVGSEDERKKNMGCGIIALADLFLYLANKSEEYRTEKNRNYVNRILTQEEYKKYYNVIYQFLGGIKVGAKGGLSCIRLQRSFNRMAHRNHWELRAKWGLRSKGLYDRIEEMLGKDIPVILCIPMMLRKKDKPHGIVFYRKKNGEYSKACIVSAHYVVITGVIVEGESKYLRISSWGEEYYVNWNEYDILIHTHFLGIILGNILYIR